ncbi:MAG: hypothetical protein KF851_16885 [Pirellulaceae bacterium]|nr:hypothetical protein [Pirellulaceae bacterium]
MRSISNKNTLIFPLIVVTVWKEMQVGNSRSSGLNSSQTSINSIVMVPDVGTGMGTVDES